MLVNVETDNLLTDRMVSRYASGNAKALAAIRATLEALGLELPAMLQRKRPGRKRREAPSSFLLHSAT